MARALNTQILVVGRKFPILPFERALAASGIPDYLCVDTLEAAEMLRADGFKPDIVIVDSELLGPHATASLRANRCAAYVVIDNDLEDFEDVLSDELTHAMNLSRIERVLRSGYLPSKPAKQPASISPAGSLFFG